MKTDRYKELFERSADAMFIIAGGNYVDCNASAVDLLRYGSKQDLLNKHPSQLSPERQPDGRISFEKANEMSAIAIERGSHRFEWDHMRADGEILPVEVSLTAVAEDNQNTLHAILRDVTRQKRSEEEKLSTENRLKAIFNHRFQLTGLLAPDGKLIMANQTACNMVGADHVELEGKYFWELPHWSHSRDLQLKVRNAIRSARKGNVVSFETTHTDSKGDIHFIDFSLTPVPDEKGEVVFIVPEGHDITTKRKAETGLIESERNYREIYNSSGDAILIHDADTGNIVDVNQTMLEMYGYSRQEALQLTVGDISTGEPQFSQKAALEKVTKAVKEGPQLFEWRAKRKDGTCFWVEVALRKTTVGGKGRVLAVVRDITQRRQLDNELRLVKYSIEHSAFPFEWVQDDSRFLYVNEATCRSLGYTREELCSMKVGDIDSDFSQEAWPEFWEQLKAEKSLSFETYHQRKNGEKFPVKITANFVEFEGQEHVFAYVQDTSDRALFEKKKKQLQRQLHQSQKMEAIGTLAGGIAHDFNNILAAIIGFTELAQMDAAGNDKVMESLRQVEQAGSRARSLVSQILAFSRQSEKAPVPVQPKVVVEEVLKLLRASLPTTIEITRDLDSDLAVIADPTQLHQVLMNLCTNAAHAMREKGGTLSVGLGDVKLGPSFVAAHSGMAPGRYVELAVGDNGHGMTPETLERIFDPFFTTKEKEEGTGMGLSVVHGIVQECGGAITVESMPGEGTEFRLYFPVAPEREIETDSVRQEGAGGTERILFVDDEEIQGELAVEGLGRFGYRVTGITDPVAALELFQRDPHAFDLVIVDMTMPKMTGDILAKRIMLERGDIPVILCTGFSERISESKAKAMGIRALAYKPMAATNMAAKIRDVLDGAEGE